MEKIHLLYLVAMLIATGLFVYVIYRRHGLSYINKNAVLIGLNGTFLGIVIALIFTDFNYMDADIRPLFSGLQVAVLSSLLGLSYYLYVGKGQSETSVIYDSLVEALIEELAASRKQQKALNENLYKFLLMQENNISIHYSNDELIAMLKQAAEKLSDDLRKINNETANTLKMTMNDMIKELGERLTDLSGKFVNDYKPLTEKLQALVLMAETLNDPKITRIVERK